MEAFDLHEMRAHVLHAVREGPDGRGHRFLLEVAKHLMAISHRFDVAQRRREEGLQVVFLSTRRDRRHHLIEIEVGEERGLLQCLGVDATLGLAEEDAAGSHDAGVGALPSLDRSAPPSDDVLEPPGGQPVEAISAKGAVQASFIADPMVAKVAPAYSRTAR